MSARVSTVSSVSKVRVWVKVIVFNYKNVCTTLRLQVHLLLYSGKIVSFTLAKKAR